MLPRTFQPQLNRYHCSHTPSFGGFTCTEFSSPHFSLTAADLLRRAPIILKEHTENMAQFVGACSQSSVFAVVTLGIPAGLIRSHNRKFKLGSYFG